MKKIIYIAFVVFHSCVYDKIPIIRFTNKTQEKLYVHLSCKDSLTNENNPVLYDSIYNIKNKFVRRIDRGLKTGKSSVIYYHNIDTFYYPCKNKKLYFFFINDSIVKSTKWSSIVKMQLYDRKVAFTKKELDKLNWMITIE